VDRLARVKPGLAELPQRALTGVALAVIVWGSPHDAAAAESLDPPVSLTWTAPPGCPSEVELAGLVKMAIGPLAERTERVRASAAAEGQGDHWRADVEVTVGALSSTRFVEGESCRGVADAVVVIVALAANPSPPPPTLPAPPVPTPPSSGARGSHGTLALGASLLVDVGSLPPTGYGAEWTAGWAFSRLDLALVGSWLAPETATVDVPLVPPQGAHIWLGELRARACYDLLGGRIGLAPCAGGGVRWVVADGFGSTRHNDATDAITVASFGARATLRIASHLTMHVGGEAVIPFTRPTFVIVPIGPVYRGSSAAARGTLGLDVHF
jgi:hypothetical protein